MIDTLDLTDQRAKDLSNSSSSSNNHTKCSELWDCLKFCHNGVHHVKKSNSIQSINNHSTASSNSMSTASFYLTPGCSISKYRPHVQHNDRKRTKKLLNTTNNQINKASVSPHKVKVSDNQFDPAWQMRKRSATVSVLRRKDNQLKIIVEEDESNKQLKSNDLRETDEPVDSSKSNCLVRVSSRKRSKSYNYYD